jgi:hypothetical protein
MNKRATPAATLPSRMAGGAVAAASRPITATVTPIGARTPSRIGKKTVAAHFDPAVSKQLKLIGLEADRSTQDLLREAINDLFAKYGKAPIA